MSFAVALTWCRESVAQTDKFEEFLNGFGRLFELATITPDALEKTIGVKVALAEKRERFLPTHYTAMTFTVVSAFDGIAVSSSKLEYLNDGNSERRTLELQIPARVYPTCIAEFDLFKKFGRPHERRQSSLRHFAAGQKPPPGLRPTTDQFIYKSRYGLSIAFVYDYSCASYVRVFEEVQ